MHWELARDWLFFIVAVLGGGLGLAPSAKNFADLEAWCVGIARAVAVLGGVVFLVHWLELSLGWFALGYAGLGLGVLVNRRRCGELVRQEPVREALAGWLLVAAGCLALLGCVFSYSGGTWMGDWEEHYHRPLHYLRLVAVAGFQPQFPFTLRPPLANTADAALLWLTGPDFSRHQVQMLLLNSLAFLPVALWTRTFGGGRATAAACGVLLLLNPLFLQNTTYAWTKLLSAYFVLIGLHLLLVRGQQRSRVVNGFALLMLGVLTHYSACVWALTLGAGWLWATRHRWPEREFRVTAGLALAVAGVVLAPWFIYAATHYGLTATLHSNPSYHFTGPLSWQDTVLGAGPKLWNTLVPHSLRHFDRSILDQPNPWTWARDYFFLVYQNNLFFGVGSASLLVLACSVVKPAWRPRQFPASVWIVTGLATVVLGTAVHGAVDPWGLAHICLQPLMLLGVAFAASRLPLMLRGGHPFLALAAAGLALADFLPGIVLHYSATAFQLNRPPGQDLFEYARELSLMAQINLSRKIFYGQDFFMDTVNLPWWLLLTVFSALVLLAGIRARRLARSDPVSKPLTGPACTPPARLS
jgi:hypothetical protein